MNIRIATLGLIVAAASGCAGNISESRHGIAAGQWNVRLPTAQSSVAGLAYGRGGNSQRAASADENAQPLLAAAPVQKRAQPVVRHTKAAVQTAVSEPVPPQVEENLAPAAPEQSASAPVMLAQADQTTVDQRYSQRQANSRQLENYKGGDAIVITAGAVLVIALIVILILLLT